MSNTGRKKSKTNIRASWEDYGIGWERYLELREGCRTGKYSRETLLKACDGFQEVAEYIIASVTKNRTYEGVEWLNGRRIMVGRSDFYGIRRRFYHNLDLLEKEQDA